MTVNELIEELRKQDGRRLVVLAIDPEGNGFHELACVDTASYADGEIGLEKLTPELRSKGYGDDDLRPNGTPAVILWP